MRFEDQSLVPPQEQNEQESSRTERILAILNELPFAKRGLGGDLENWQRTADSLSQKKFASLDEFSNAVKTELESKEWTDEEKPAKIMKYIEDISDLIQSWQEKK